MTDQEKIINGMKSLHARLLDAATRNKIAMLDAMIVEDALALLKAQEPLPVKYTTSTIRCPKCNKQITSRGAIHNEIRFCWKCGQAVKWE